MATIWTCLIRIKNKEEERSHLIEKTSFNIGRAEEAGFPITEASVSRAHLDVELRGPFVYITDLKSGNGTRVNGQKIEPGVAIPVTMNDVVQLGRATLDFQFLSIPKPTLSASSVLATIEAPLVPTIPPVPQTHPSLIDLHNQKQALELQIAGLKQELAASASEERLKYAAQADQLVTDAHKKIAEDYQEASQQIDTRMRQAQEKLFSMTQDSETRARQTLQEAQDEAVKIRLVATEQTRAIHQEALQRNSVTLASLQEKFQADMASKREELIARAKVEGERERAKALKDRADEITNLEKAMVILKSETQPLQDQHKLAVDELKKIDEVTTQARRELERNSKNAEEIRSWVAKTVQAKAEMAEAEKSLASLQARLNEAQTSIMQELAALRQKALLNFENEKKESHGDLAKSKLRALEEIQKRIQDEEKKYGETLHLRSIELAQKLSAKLVPALPDLIREPDLAGARMKAAIEAATSETLMNGRSSFTAPSVEGLAAPLKTRDERAKRQRQIGAAVVVVAAVIVTVFGKDIYNYSKSAETHSYANEKVQERQEAAVYHPDRDPRYGKTYRESYVENVLFLKGYYEAKTDSLNQQKWLLNLNDLTMLRPMGLTEDDIVRYISKENALIARLAGLQSKIDGVYADQGLKTMAEAEAEDVAEMKRILKSEANFKKIRDLERTFVVQLIH